MINIGIDVHKVRCVATIKSGRGRKLEQLDFANDKDGINGFIGHVKEGYGRRGPARAVCESTANYWIRLHDTLERHGIDTALAHPAKTKVIAHAKLRDDKLDSEMLADLLRSGMIYESFVPDKHYRDLRSMVRTRLGCVRESTRHKNRIHAILAKYDHAPPARGLFSKLGMLWLSQIELSDTDRMSVDVHVDAVEMATRHVTRIESSIARIASDDDRARLLTTIPGISYVTAITLIAETVDTSRFRTAEKFAASGGVIPSHRNSASTYRGGCGCATRQSRRPPRRYGTTSSTWN
ncbi:MAG: IS110 family transposase [Nitrosopumilaceae archaeon]|nr:IS110 family transposase [Nitrosopumilaceae archaeon]